MQLIRKNPFAAWLFIGVFIYAAFLGQGIPLWDDDFTSWFWKIQDKSVFHYFFEWLSPISTQPQYWGFNERPAESVFYKICYAISGYESWSYFLVRDLCYAGNALMIYFWGLRLARSQWAALGAAVFFTVAPGPLAAHLLQCDFAPMAELWFLVTTYFIWREVEATPSEWGGFPSFSRPEVKAWMKRWATLSFVTYLGYKTKADLKLIPAILGAYILLVRRSQWRYFAFPIGAMILLAVPWGPGVFTKLPPFVPGSQGSEIGWMWQPASLGRMTEFVWGGSWSAFFTDFRGPCIALLSLLGPYLLVPMTVFLLWKMEAFDKVKWGTREQPEDRARIFALVWLAVVLLATSALAPINFTFRIRYGILTLVPASIVLAWVFGLFARTYAQLPKWVAYVLIAGFSFQCLINLYRSTAYRRDMGIVMISTDQAYEYVDEHFHDQSMALMPDFRPYDYRPSAGAAIRNRQWLGAAEDLDKKKFKPGETAVVSWHPSLWDAVEQVGHFSGCRSTNLFDHLWPCPPASGTFVMRYIGHDPLYAEGEVLRGKGDLAQAKERHARFLLSHPDSMAALFVYGLENYGLKDWNECDRAFSRLEEFFPEHPSIIYNRALALGELHRYREAVDRLRGLAAHDPSNYAVQINLYYDLVHDGRKSEAKELIGQLKRIFPNDQEIGRLFTQG